MDNEDIDPVLISWDEEDMLVIPYDPQEWLRDLGKPINTDSNQ